MTESASPTPADVDVAFEREDFWHPRDLREAANTPTGSRVGPLLFLSAQVGRRLTDGALVTGLWDLDEGAEATLSTGYEHRDGREGPVQAQTWAIYKNLEEILDAQGSGIEHIVRQKIFVFAPKDLASAEEAMLRFFPGEKPATTLTTLSACGIDPRIRVQVEVVALVPGQGVEKEAVYVDGLEAVTAPYPQAVQVGQLLFTSGILGVNPQTGRIATRLDELPDQAREILEQGRLVSDRGAEKLKTQVAFFFLHLKAILESRGGTQDDMLRQNFFTTMGMQEWGLGSMVFRPRYYSGKHTAPTSAGVTVPAINADPDAVVITDAVALLPGGPWAKEGQLDPVIDMTHLPMTITAGPLAYTTGFVAMEKNFHGAVTSFAELADSGRGLGAGRPDATEPLVSQAWYTYDAIARMLRDAGSDMSKVVHQTVLMRDASYYGVLEQVALKLYGGSLPPTTILACDDIGPYPGLLFEVETVAVR
jgi:enamine deaminase RidA (YjgF/YER057c/UK114 family)